MNTAPQIVRENNRSWETWKDETLAAASAIRWKTFISADHTDSTALTCGVVEVPVGERLMLHHHGRSEVYYVLSGIGQMQLQEAEYRVDAGTAIFIPANVPHALTNTGGESLRFFYTFPAHSFQNVTYTFDEQLT